MDFTAQKSEMLNSPSWQFHVYSLGRFVVKIKKSPRQVVRSIRLSRWGDTLGEDGIVRLADEVRRNCKNALLAVRRNKKSRSLSRSPIIFPDVGYVQRRGTTFLNAYLENPANGKKIIDDFFDLTLDLWRIGLFEMTFDFLRNCGYSREGCPFQLDLGDITDDLQTAYPVLEQRRWATRLDLFFLPPPHREYFMQTAAKFLTKKQLDTVWGSKR